MRRSRAHIAALAVLVGCATQPAPPAVGGIVIVDPPARAAPAATTPMPVDPRWPESRRRVLADSVRAVLAAGYADSAFPGAYAVIGTSRGVLAQDSVGRLDWAANEPIPNAHTLWDLASLTKVIGLTTAMMQLAADGRLSLDDPVQKYLPEFTGEWKDQVRIRHLLTHTGGLPNWRPLHKEAENAQAARALLLATPLESPPGTRAVYSDLEIIIAGWVVERVANTTLDQYLATKAFAPLGMTETMYRPPQAIWPRVAPTEIDPWRQRHLRGEVHDENAFALGGVSAHAGLFSSAADLTKFARMYLNRGTLDGVRVLDSAWIDRFTAWQDSASHNRALGWMKPARGSGWFGGSRMSSRAFGHTGFTGTSIYIDPERDVFVLLLTNRVNPTRMRTGIGTVRTRLADAAMSVVLTPAPAP